MVEHLFGFLEGLLEQETNNLTGKLGIGVKYLDVEFGIGIGYLEVKLGTGIRYLEVDLGIGIGYLEVELDTRFGCRIHAKNFVMVERSECS